MRMAMKTSITTDTLDHASTPLHLAEYLSSVPRHASVAWIGGRVETFQPFCREWRERGFEGRILIPGWASVLLSDGVHDTGVALGDLSRSVPDVVVVDFGMPAGSNGGVARQPLTATLNRAIGTCVQRDFSMLLAAERERLEDGATPRRFACLDADRQEPVVRDAIEEQGTFGGGRLRYGIVRCQNIPKKAVSALERLAAAVPPTPLMTARLRGNLIGIMHVGESGRRIDGGVLAPLGSRGVVVHGPHRLVPPGDYRFEIAIEPRGPWSLTGLVRPVVVEVSLGPERLVTRRFSFFLRGTFDVPFTIPRGAAQRTIYLRLVRGRWVHFVVKSVRLMQMTSAIENEAPDPSPHRPTTP